MSYPKIIAEIERIPWAITPEAMASIYSVIDSNPKLGDYEACHKTEALSDLDTKKPMIIGDRGLIVINGPIIPRATAFSETSGIVSIDKLTQDFKALEANESVEKIQILIDSPGGAITGISDFAALIKSSKKITSAFVVGQAASAAYWIASAADYIISTDTGQAGSIGMVLTHQTTVKSGERVFISSQSPHKRLNPDTKEGRFVAQKLVNEIADVFIGAVATNRNVSIDAVLEDFGKGGVLLAKDALAVGMIDGISTIDEFMTDTKKEKKSLSSDATPMSEILGRQGAEIKNPLKSRGKGLQQMTLAEFLAENPAARIEYEMRLKDEFEAGKTALRNEHGKIAVYLQGEAYPNPVKALALRVIKGESSYDALEGAATVIDVQREEAASKLAKVESQELPDTPLVVAEAQPSADGQIRNMIDVEAFWNPNKSGNGGKVEVA
jgi:ClpP class serine protease